MHILGAVFPMPDTHLVHVAEPGVRGGRRAPRVQRAHGRLRRAARAHGGVPPALRPPGGGGPAFTSPGGRRPARGLRDPQPGRRPGGRGGGRHRRPPGPLPGHRPAGHVHPSDHAHPGPRGHHALQLQLLVRRPRASARAALDGALRARGDARVRLARVGRIRGPSSWRHLDRHSFAPSTGSHHGCPHHAAAVVGKNAFDDDAVSLLQGHVLVHWNPRQIDGDGNPAGVRDQHHLLAGNPLHAPIQAHRWRCVNGWSETTQQQEECDEGNQMDLRVVEILPGAHCTYLQAIPWFLARAGPSPVKIYRAPAMFTYPRPSRARLEWLSLLSEGTIATIMPGLSPIIRAVTHLDAHQLAGTWRGLTVTSRTARRSRALRSAGVVVSACRYCCWSRIALIARITGLSSAGGGACVVMVPGPRYFFTQLYCSHPLSW